MQYAPVVVGKELDRVHPTTQTLSFSSRLRSVASSRESPPRKVPYRRSEPEPDNMAKKPSLFPPLQVLQNASERDRSMLAGCRNYLDGLAGLESVAVLEKDDVVPKSAVG